RLRLGRQPDAQLRVVLHFFARARPGRRPADRSGLGPGCHALATSPKRVVVAIAVFVLPKTACILRRSGLPMPKKLAKSVRTRLHQTRAQNKPGPGRPPVHNESGSKVSVVLFDRQIRHLDRLATDGRGKAGKALNRAEIIRALIDGMIDSGIDVHASASEADLRATVARRLGTSYR